MVIYFKTTTTSYIDLKPIFIIGCTTRVHLMRWGMLRGMLWCMSRCMPRTHASCACQNLEADQYTALTC